MYNEIENIKPCVQGALSIGQKLHTNFEIIVVDDASTDGCGELADQMTEEIPELKVIHHEKNRKLGGTLRTGFQQATKDYILYMDSDLPLDFDDVAQAITQIGSADVLIGYRLTRDESFKRKVLSWGYNTLIRSLFGLIDAELLIEAKRAGYHIAEVGLPYHPRIAGESTLASTAVIQKTFQEMGSYFLKKR